MPLAQRATRALEIAQATDPTYAAWDVPNPETRRRRGRMARALAAILGVDPASVIAAADPDRSYGGYPGHLLTVIDNEVTYRFVPTGGFSEDGFCLLARAPDAAARYPSPRSTSSPTWATTSKPGRRSSSPTNSGTATTTPGARTARTTDHRRLTRGQLS